MQVCTVYGFYCIPINDTAFKLLSFLTVWAQLLETNDVVS